MNPLHQFQIHKLINLNLFGYDISFTNSSLCMMIVIVALSCLFIAASRKSTLIPTRLQAIVEFSYVMISDMVKENIGKEGKKYIPLIFAIFFFILGGNLLGMVPYSFTYTSHIIVTFGLALGIMTIITIIGFKIHGMHFLKFFVPEGVPSLLVPLVVPIEVISYLSRPLSLAVRLFANMLAGHTMLKVFAGFSITMSCYYCWWVPLLVNIALTGFEIVVAGLQAYVFAILSCLYLNDAINMH